MATSHPTEVEHLERFSIIHLSLQEIATGDAPDEGASTEELGESILYNFLPGTGSNEVGTLPGLDVAVRLAGMVTALWSLPLSLGAPQQRHFQFVRLSNHNLLLTLLEDNVLAVTQFSKGALVTPEAMVSLIKRHYNIFGLTSGGGIDKRLRSNSSSTTVPDGSCAYPGMRKLFAFHRKIRKQRETAHVQGGSSMVEELDRIRSQLPVSKLRSDLKEHFDMFCLEWEGLRRQNPVCGRSIINRTPFPIQRSSCLHWFDNDSTCIHLKGKMTEFFETSDEDNNAALGVSIFTQGQFLCTVVPPAVNFAISSEDACLTMHYLASIRHQLPTEHPPQEAGFIRRTLGGFLQGGNSNHVSGFLGPPPLSMLGAAVQDIPTCTVGKGVNNLVWVPSLTLGDVKASIRACLYSHGEYSVLLYLDPARETSYTSTLGKFLSYILDLKPPESSVDLLESWNRPGQEIIWVDRKRQRTVVYSSQRSSRAGQERIHPDDRYRLASLLSLDTLLALDDAIGHSILESPSRYESCTLLWRKWLVSRAQDGRELYVILDARHFVTIHDVTKAMEEIERHFAMDTGSSDPSTT